MKKISKVLVGLTAVVAILVLAACSAAPGESTNTTGNRIGKTFKMGYDIEMTGAVAAYGESWRTWGRYGCRRNQCGWWY